MDSNRGHAAVVLAAHGAPPTDYPRFRVGIMMMLEYAPRPVRRLGPLRAWHDRLVREVTSWPRNVDNDPYKAAVDQLAAAVAVRLGLPVIAGYNEFCAPTVAEAIDQAIAGGAGQVLVLPTMLLRGNTHTESEISDAVICAGRRHPHADIQYAWPFPEESMVSLFAGVVFARINLS